MNIPLLSIITINCNNQRGLAATIDSVLKQEGFAEYEYLVIDGGSTDGSVDLIHQYQNNFAHWVSEKDAGIYDAMNKGIQKATGKYLLFLNSGDFLMDNHVLANCKEALWTGTDIVYGNIIIDHLEVVKKNPSPLTLSNIFLWGIAHQGMFFKKTLFEKAGLYDTAYKIVADMCHLIICLVRYNASSLYINRTIAKVEPGGISTVSIVENHNEYQRFMNTEFPAIAKDYERLLKYHSKNYLLRLKNLLLRIMEGWRR